MESLCHLSEPILPLSLFCGPLVPLWALTRHINFLFSMHGLKAHGSVDREEDKISVLEGNHGDNNGKDEGEGVMAGKSSGKNDVDSVLNTPVKNIRVEVNVASKEIVGVKGDPVVESEEVVPVVVVLVRQRGVKMIESQ